MEPTMPTQDELIEAAATADLVKTVCERALSALLRGDDAGDVLARVALARDIASASLEKLKKIISKHQ